MPPRHQQNSSDHHQRDNRQLLPGKSRPSGVVVTIFDTVFLLTGLRIEQTLSPTAFYSPIADEISLQHCHNQDNQSVQ